MWLLLIGVTATGAPARPALARCDSCQLSSLSHILPCCCGLLEIVSSRSVLYSQLLKGPGGGKQEPRSCRVALSHTFFQLHVKCEEHPIERSSSHLHLDAGWASQSCWHTGQLFGPCTLFSLGRSSWGVVVDSLAWLNSQGHHHQRPHPHHHMSPSHESRAWQRAAAGLTPPWGPQREPCTWE